MGKIFAIGDIHGCLDKLKVMMERIDIDGEEDTLVFIGDYIDRGPDPKGVVEFVLNLKSKLKNVVCLLGNHEQTFLNFYFHRKDGDLFYFNGGDTTIESYGLIETAGGKKINVPESHLDFFKSLVPYYETDEYIFVHAGIRSGIPMEKQNVDDLIWIRYEFIRSFHDFGKIVVFGHTPLPDPLIQPNKIGIDTGACYGGELTCVVLPETRIIQV
ncbi:MAG: serine/threonine protein phosphatase [Deltaproteobacteria bacterium]|nr:serine/threonine protein phosphatase [Deltaproteobacteria bacterium]